MSDVIHLLVRHLAVVAVGGVGAMDDVHSEAAQVGRGLQAVAFAWAGQTHDCV